jgi:hypothetical protein
MRPQTRNLLLAADSQTIARLKVKGVEAEDLRDDQPQQN